MLLLDWMIDYLYMFYGQLIMLINKTPSKDYLDPTKPNKESIILLPGLANCWGFLKKIADQISFQGYPVFVIDKLGYNFRDIPSQAKIVNDFIKNHNLNNVILVGHSKGGLIGKYLLVYFNQNKNIKGLIAIATPFCGSFPAKYIPFKPYQEVALNSQLIQDLQSYEEVNQKIISITPSFDDHIWVDKHRNLKGAENIKLDVKGHSKIVFDQETIDQVIHGIKKF